MLWFSGAAGRLEQLSCRSGVLYVPRVLLVHVCGPCGVCLHVLVRVRENSSEFLSVCMSGREFACPAG